jgi:hypothetical protein
MKQRIAYTPREFAKLCGFSWSLLYQLWRQGEGPPFKQIGKKKRIIEHEAGLAWLRDSRPLDHLKSQVEP